LWLVVGLEVDTDMAVRAVRVVSELEPVCQ
jgi:hypothetical protein